MLKFPSAKASYRASKGEFSFFGKYTLNQSYEFEYPFMRLDRMKSWESKSDKPLKLNLEQRVFIKDIFDEYVPPVSESIREHELGFFQHASDDVLRARDEVVRLENTSEKKRIISKIHKSRSSQSWVTFLDPFGKQENVFLSNLQDHNKSPKSTKKKTRLAREISPKVNFSIRSIKLYNHH